MSTTVAVWGSEQTIARIDTIVRELMALRWQLLSWSGAASTQRVGAKRDTTGADVRIVQEGGLRGAVFAYPTIGLPAASLNWWLDLVPHGYDGDGLADTEALYNEV